MSSGPVGTGSTCIEVTKRKYVNINFNQDLWCTYEGECPRYLLVFHRDEVCTMCKYRKPLDIPSIIEARKKEVE